ncbi:hypothetical protein MLD52_22330 [Puniceicoccaceae bacterium K14]|nr:hypothetical protein [Puniceicoccaceae bacterium K14]
MNRITWFWKTVSRYKWVVSLLFSLQFGAIVFADLTGIDEWEIEGLHKAIQGRHSVLPYTEDYLEQGLGFPVLVLGHSDSVGRLRKTVEGPGVLQIGFWGGLTPITDPLEYSVLLNGLKAERQRVTLFDEYRIPEGVFDVEFEITAEEMKGNIFHFEYNAGYSLQLRNTSSVPLNGGLLVNGAPLEGQTRYAVGEELIIEANPADYYEFVGWEDEFAGFGKVFILVMDGDKTLSPVFQLSEPFYHFSVEGFIGKEPEVVSVGDAMAWRYELTEDDLGVNSIVLSIPGHSGYLKVEESGFVDPEIGELFLMFDGVDIELPTRAEGFLFSLDVHEIKLSFDPSQLDLEFVDGVAIVEVLFPVVEKSEISYLEWWNYYDTEMLGNEDAMEPSLDFDGDGLSNFIEFILARNPVLEDMYLNIGFDNVAKKITLTHMNFSESIGHLIGLFEYDSTFVTKESSAEWMPFQVDETTRISEENLGQYKTEIQEIDGELKSLYRYQELVTPPSLEFFLSLE